jgi:hypothetical protein
MCEEMQRLPRREKMGDKEIGIFKLEYERRMGDRIACALL